MRTHCIVMAPPGPDQHLRLLQVVEDLDVQQLVAQLAIEPFDVAILPWATRLDSPADPLIGDRQVFADELLADAGVQYEWCPTPFGDVAWAVQQG